MDTSKLYKNCSELPIFNFFELVKTKDLKWLLRPGADFIDFDKEELADLLIDILREYNAITNNDKLLKEYIATLDIEYSEARYNTSKKILSLYLEFGDIEVLLILKDLGWSINEMESIIPQLKRIHDGLIGLKNKIKIKKSNFLKKYKKKITKPSDGDDLDKQVIYLENALPLSYKIDIYTDSIKRFAYWNELLESKNKQLNNG